MRDFSRGFKQMKALLPVAMISWLTILLACGESGNGEIGIDYSGPDLFVLTGMPTGKMLSIQTY